MRDGVEPFPGGGSTKKSVSNVLKMESATSSARSLRASAIVRAAFWRSSNEREKRAGMPTIPAV
jgi:hypothetical protein